MLCRRAEVDARFEDSQRQIDALRDEQKKLEEILGSPAALKRTVIKEIEADA